MHRERAVRHTEAKLRALLAAVDEMMLIIAADGAFLEVVPTRRQPLSCPAEKMVGARISDVYPKEITQLAMDTIRSVLATSRTLHLDYSLPAGDAVIWYSAEVSPLDESTVIWIARDVTQQKATEAALEQRVQERTRELSTTIEALHVSEERFRLLARSTTEAVWDLDLTTGKVWRGSGYEKLFGYEDGPFPLELDAWRRRVHPDDLRGIDEGWKEAIESGALSWSIEYRFLRSDGSYAQILDLMHIVRDDRKRAIRALGAMIDVTAQKQLAEELEATKRVTSLGRIAASIAHEINNVLMAIQPNAEVLQRRAPAELRGITENITHSVRRGKRITEEILRFTRPSDLHLECVDVASFLERWARTMRSVLGKRIQLKVELAENSLCILADADQLAHAFNDLALNAREMMRDGGGTLLVRAELAKSWGSFRFGVVKSPDRFVHFTLRDEGHGISSDQLPHVFEPLFSTGDGGAGLGLAVAHQIVTRHEGHIFAESELGHGSTFHLFIPNTLPAVSEPVPQAQRAAIGRLLLVEDEPAVASGIAMLLEMEGIQVETVGTGREAIPAIERFGPDVVILDIGLPDIDGVGVYEAIDRRWPHLPVVFSSGHADGANIDRYLSRSNVRFLRKPYDFDTIRSMLAEIIS